MNLIDLVRRSWLKTFFCGICLNGRWLLTAIWWRQRVWRLVRRGRPVAPLPSPWSPPQPPRRPQPPTEPLGELTSRCTRVTAPPSPRSLSDWRQRLSRVGCRLPPPPNGANRSQPRSGPSLGPPQILVHPWWPSWEKGWDWFLIDPIPAENHFSWNKEDFYPSILNKL